MIHRSLFLSSAALLLPLYPAAAQQAQQPSVPAAQAPAATAPPAQTDAVQAPAAPAAAGAAQPVDEEGDEEEIVITGAKPRGSVVGDIPPENTLDARDVRATGATNITELLDAIAPQIGSARGRGGERPVLLLNGQRIASFREMRDIPTEAIQRVEILPEEVALEIRVSRRSEGGEHRPSPALPLDDCAGRRRGAHRRRQRQRQWRPYPFPGSA